MLGPLSPYLQRWQLLPIGFFFLASILGGGAVLRLLLARQFAQTQAPAPGRRRRRRVSYGRAVLAVLLAGIGGLFAAAALMMLFHNIAQAARETPIWPYVVGGALALAALPGVAYLIILTMFPLPAGGMFRAAGATIGLVLMLAGLLGTPTAILARHQRLTKLYQDYTVRRNLPLIDEAIREYEVSNNVPPPALPALADAGFIEAGYLRSPADPDQNTGYFYMPKRSAPRGLDSDEIRLCDYRSAFEGKGRGVLFVNGRTQWYDEDAFQELLKLDVNSDFAEALRKAAGG